MMYNRSLTKGIKYLFQLNGNERLEILYIVVLIIKFKLIVNFVPLRYYYKKFFEYSQNQNFDLQPFHRELSLITKVMKFTPWKITCLMESLIIKSYLLKYEVDIPIMIGIKTNDKLQAHAWYIPSSNRGFVELKSTS